LRRSILSKPFKVRRPEIAGAHGDVHLLINNAAISALASLADTSGTDFERIMQVNFVGTVYGCRAFMPFLKKYGEGQTLNVSSFAGLDIPATPGLIGRVSAFSTGLW